MDLLQSLLNEKEMLLRRLQDIDATLMKLQNSEQLNPNEVGLELKNHNAISEVYNEIDSKKGFPIKLKKAAKLRWLFKNVFTQGLRFQEIQDVFNDYNGLDAYGREVRLESTVRVLKSKGDIKAVKYNNSNKLSFWGLSEWIEGDDFKDEYKPKDEFLPTLIESREVIG